jgi:hypothetical protein
MNVELLTNPTFVVAIAGAVATLLIGIVFRDKKEFARGCFFGAAICGVVACTSFLNKESAKNPVKAVPAAGENRVIPQHDKGVVDQFPGHNVPPKIKADQAGFSTKPPTPTFDPKSKAVAPKSPFPVVQDPTGKMPVTLKPVETPKDHVPKGQPQTFGPQRGRWVQQPDGSWSLILDDAPPKGGN